MVEQPLIVPYHDEAATTEAVSQFLQLSELRLTNGPAGKENNMHMDQKGEKNKQKSSAEKERNLAAGDG